MNALISWLEKHGSSLGEMEKELAHDLVNKRSAVAKLREKLGFLTSAAPKEADDINHLYTPEWNKSVNSARDADHAFRKSNMEADRFDALDASDDLREELGGLGSRLEDAEPHANHLRRYYDKKSLETEKPYLQHNDHYDEDLVKRSKNDAYGERRRR